jgi:hypothetical protein
MLIDRLEVATGSANEVKCELVIMLRTAALRSFAVACMFAFYPLASRFDTAKPGARKARVLLL